MASAPVVTIDPPRLHSSPSRFSSPHTRSAHTSTRSPPRPLVVSSNTPLGSAGSESEQWTPDSWRKFPFEQQPDYVSPAASPPVAPPAPSTSAFESLRFFVDGKFCAGSFVLVSMLFERRNFEFFKNSLMSLQPAPTPLEAVTTRIQRSPPLVSPQKINKLKSLLAAAGQGRAFIVHGGDCAERFIDCTPEHIEKKMKILFQIGVILSWGSGTRVPVIKIGRIAGQYFKPRSSPTERLPDGRLVPSFRGDGINQFDVEQRKHQPEQLFRAYSHAAKTIGVIDSLLDQWDLGFESHDRHEKYHELTQTAAADSSSPGEASLDQLDFFTSHEGPILRHFCASALDRTGAHIEFFRGIANPIGIKICQKMLPETLVSMIQKLNPSNQPGKIVLITRLSTAHVATALPPLIRAVQQARLCVVWECDPMHGNTVVAAQGVKTREFGVILDELKQTFEIHASLGSRLAGVHLELTDRAVTECMGGPQGLEEHELVRNYETYCDPRLNQSQSVAMAFELAELVKLHLHHEIGDLSDKAEEE